jgi:NADH:ubiquinone oxidoreductase subunit K
MTKNILCIVLFTLGTGIVWFQYGFLTYLGIFFLLWANNIGIMHTIEKMQKRDSSILKILFGHNSPSEEEIQAIMSQKMRVSDK